MGSNGSRFLGWRDLFEAQCNGYKIRFNEIPSAETKIGYIVLEWIDEKPSIEYFQEFYGCELPNNVIILPLWTKKVDTVKEQLANIHPEVIMFMSKIQKLSVHEYNEDSTLNKVM